MGYIRHDAIVATTWDPPTAEKSREKAISIGLPVSEIVASPVNTYVSFLIAPDGSNEGWEASEEGNRARDAWKKWTRENLPHVNWSHISFGGDNDERSTLLDHSGAQWSVDPQPAYLGPQPHNFPLWKFFHDNHGLTLMESELDDIIRAVTAVKWHRRSEPTPRMKKLWASDGKTVWQIFGDGEPISPAATLVKYWAEMIWPDPPAPTHFAEQITEPMAGAIDV